MTGVLRGALGYRDAEGRACEGGGRERVKLPQAKGPGATKAGRGREGRPLETLREHGLPAP